MRFCLSIVAVLGLALGAAAQTRKIASVVRADARTGRLVRAVAAPTARAKSAPAHVDLGEFISKTAQAYDVDPMLVHSVIAAESAYNPYAVSRKGAQGLMQLMPGTARRLSVKDAFDPYQNVEGGIRHLKSLLTRFGGEMPLALAAYNAGEGAVIKHGGIPPYAETRQYVRKVASRLGEAPEPAGAQAPLRDATPAYLPIEQFVDSEGTLHLRTRSSP